MGTCADCTTEPHAMAFTALSTNHWAYLCPSLNPTPWHITKSLKKQASEVGSRARSGVIRRKFKTSWYKPSGFFFQTKLGCQPWKLRDGLSMYLGSGPSLNGTINVVHVKDIRRIPKNQKAMKSTKGETLHQKVFQTFRFLKIFPQQTSCKSLSPERV